VRVHNSIGKVESKLPPSDKVNKLVRFNIHEGIEVI
jgi:hypothetical protein